MKHSEEFEALAAEARSRVNEISVAQTLRRIEDGAELIDVREDNEWEAGHAADAVHLSRGIIERDVVQIYPDKETELI